MGTSASMTVDEIKALPHYRKPEVGGEVCLPTRLYISHGRDDFAGGMATITKVIRDDCKNEMNSLFITTAEAGPNTRNNWYSLMRDEPVNLERYGHRRAHPDPDLHPSSNPPNYGW